MASTCYERLEEHAELCTCARKTKVQTINAETNNSVSGLFMALFASMTAFFAAFRREEECAFVAA